MRVRRLSSTFYSFKTKHHITVNRNTKEYLETRTKVETYSRKKNNFWAFSNSHYATQVRVTQFLRQTLHWLQHCAKTTHLIKLDVFFFKSNDFLPVCDCVNIPSEALDCTEEVYQRVCSMSIYFNMASFS